MLLIVFSVLPSPRYEQSIYVFCDSIRRGGTPVGTCFAISERHVMTCYHCLAKTCPAAKLLKIYSITFSVERIRRTELLEFETQRDVRLRYYNELSDYAILEVVGPENLPEFIPISVEEVRSDTDVKIFYCPVGIFRDGGDRILGVNTVWAKTLKGTKHHLRCNAGLYRGSSGAPVVLRNGSVVAFHQESGSEARILNTQELEQMDLGEATELISETVNSVATAYTATSYAVEIRKCRQLVEILRNEGILQE
jgi:hypothetical protein